MRALLLLAALGSGVTILVHICTYGVAVPFWDEWGHVAIWNDYSTGKLTWLDVLASSSGEHRVVVQILGSIVPWVVTGFNVRAIMILNWCLAALIPLLGFLVTKTAAGSEGLAPWFVLAITSFFVFHPSAYQLWMWAILPAYLFVPLLLLAAAYVAITRASPGMKIITAAVAASVASFTFGGGLLLWGLLPLVITQAVHWRRLLQERAAVAFYGLCLGGTAIGYAPLVVRGVHHAPPSAVETSALHLPAFVLAYTGNLVLAFPVANYVLWAQCVGAVILLFGTVTGYMAVRVCRHRPEWPAVSVWLALSGYCVAAALLVAWGRRTFGVAYAVESSRYVLSSAFLPSAVVALATLILCRLDRSRLRYAVLLGCVVALVSAAAVIRAAQFPQAQGAFRGSYFSQLEGKVAIAAADLVESPKYKQVVPWDNFPRFRELARFLSDSTGYRPKMWDDAFVRKLGLAEPQAGDCGFFGVQRSDAGTVRVDGWAFLPKREERAHAVIIGAGTTDGRFEIVGVAYPSISRPDVAVALKSQAAAPTGWSIDIPTAVVSGKSLRSFAYDAEGGGVCRLAGEVRVD